MTTVRASGDRGQVAGIEAIPFGLLVLMVGSLIVASAWSVVDCSPSTGGAFVISVM